MRALQTRPRPTAPSLECKDEERVREMELMHRSRTRTAKTCANFGRTCMHFLSCKSRQPLNTFLMNRSSKSHKEARGPAVIPQTSLHCKHYECKLARTLNSKHACSGAASGGSTSIIETASKSKIMIVSRESYSALLNTHPPCCVCFSELPFTLT